VKILLNTSIEIDWQLRINTLAIVKTILVCFYLLRKSSNDESASFVLTNAAERGWGQLGQFSLGPSLLGALEGLIATLSTYPCCKKGRGQENTSY